MRSHPTLHMANDEHSYIGHWRTSCRDYLYIYPLWNRPITLSNVAHTSRLEQGLLTCASYSAALYHTPRLWYFVHHSKFAQYHSEINFEVSRKRPHSCARNNYTCASAKTTVENDVLESHTVTLCVSLSVKQAQIRQGFQGIECFYIVIGEHSFI